MLGAVGAVCVCVHAYVQVCTSVHACVHMYAYACVAYLCTHVLGTCAYVHVHMCALVQQVFPEWNASLSLCDTLLGRPE